MKINRWLLAIVIVLAPNCLIAVQPSSLELLFGRQEIMDKLGSGNSESLYGRRNEAEQNWASQHEWYSGSDSDSEGRSHWRSLHEQSTLPPGLRKSGKSRRSWTSD
jgi:hypothetical protein